MPAAGCFEPGAAVLVAGFAAGSGSRAATGMAAAVSGVATLCCGLSSCGAAVGVEGCDASLCVWTPASAEALSARDGGI